MNQIIDSLPATSRELRATSEVAKRAKQLLPHIHEGGAQADLDGKISEEVFAAMRDAGLFEILAPRSVGGAELDPNEALDVITITSYGDAATGWVQMIGSVTVAASGAYLGEDAAMASLQATLTLTLRDRAHAQAWRNVSKVATS